MTKPLAVLVRWEGRRQPPRPWLAQLEYTERGRVVVETLPGDHETEALALAAARREIAKRAAAGGL